MVAHDLEGQREACNHRVYQSRDTQFRPWQSSLRNCFVVNESRPSITLKFRLINWEISQATSGQSKVYKLSLLLLALLAFSNNNTIHNLFLHLEANKCRRPF